MAQWLKSFKSGNQKCLIRWKWKKHGTEQWEQYHTLDVKMIYMNAGKCGDYAWRGIQVGSIRKAIEWQEDKFRMETFHWMTLYLLNFVPMCTHCVFTVFEQKRRRRRKNRTGLSVNITLSQVQVLSFIHYASSWTSVVLPVQFPFFSFLVTGLIPIFSPCVWGTWWFEGYRCDPIWAMETQAQDFWRSHI